MRVNIRKSFKRLLNRIGFNRLLHYGVFRIKDVSSTNYRGVRLAFPSNTEYGQQLLRGDYNEDKVISFIAERISNSDGLFLDIGANLGVFSLALGHLTGIQAMAFEPEPLNFLYLKNNLALNPSIRGEAINVACGKSDGGVLDFTVPFQANRGVPFVGRYENPPLFTWELRVAERSVDSLLLEKGNPPVSCFKIDVESYEENVLQGMLGTLDRNPSISGLVELHPHFRPVDCQAIHSLLRGHGFVIHELTRQGLLLSEPDTRSKEGYTIWVEKRT
jgi:FkbM family methyltransferase